MESGTIDGLVDGYSGTDILMSSYNELAEVYERIELEHIIVEGENIMVYGDYDVDGTTSVALMSSYLKTKTENTSNI